MLFRIFGVDQDVINEYHDKLVHLWHEYGLPPRLPFQGDNELPTHNP
jgi:hypothetical protein